MEFAAPHARGEGMLAKHRLYFRLMRRILSLPARYAHTPFEQALPWIAEALGGTAALVGRVEGDVYTVVYGEAPGLALRRGEATPLDETYCGDTMRAGGVVARALPEVAEHPAARRFGAAAYIGAPVVVNGRPWGTLSVWSAGPRPAPFDEADRALMETLAAWAGATLERKAEETRLQETETLFRGLVEQSLTGIYVVQEGRIRYANPRLAEILGFSLEELRGAPIFPLVVEEDHALVRENIRRRFEGEISAMGYEFRVRRADGGVRHVSVYSRIAEYRGAPAIIGTMLDVTEQKAMEAGLRESEARLRALLSALPDVLFRVRRDGLVLDYVGAAHAESPVSPESLVGQPLGDLLPSDVRIPAMAALEKAFETRTLQSFEYALDHDDGGHYEARVVPDQADTALVVVRDLSERKRAEMTLERTRRLNRLLLESTLDGYILAGTRGEIIDVNPAYCRMIGYTHEELTRMNIRALEAAMDPEAVKRRISQMLADGGARFQTRHRRKDGSLIDLDVSIVIVQPEEEPLVAAFVRDITEFKRSETDLQQSKTRLRMALDAAGGGAFFCDMGAGVARWDERSQAIFGVTLPDGILDFDIWVKRLHPDDRDAVLRQYEEALATENGFEMQYRIIRPDGEIRHISVQSIIVRDASDAPVRVYGMHVDITEQKRAEEEREALIRELERRNAELERFTYTVSHDLKSPLVTIHGFLGMLEKDVAAGATDRVAQDIRHIGRAATTMKELLNDLLELSRSGRLVHPSTTIPMKELVNAALERVGGELEARGVTVDVPGDLPSLFGDRARLIEVFQNLLSNAVKFMGDQPHPHIEIGGRATPGETLCFIRDNGIGIAPAYHEKIFDLFERLDLDVEGTGIGLTLVKRIIELHGGRVWVVSEGPGRGSTFCFALPTSGKDAAS